MNQRSLIVIALLAIFVTAGCVGGLNQTEFIAPPAEVTDGVAEENGFELRQMNQFEVNETIEFGGGEYEVNASNWIALYEKSEEIPAEGQSVETQSFSIFGVISTPSAEVGGQQLNPLASTPTDEVLTRVTDRSENVEIKEKVGESTVEHDETGDDITVEKYDAVFTVQDREIDGYVLISVFQHKDAVIVTGGVYPEQLSQEEAIKEMIGQTEVVDDPSEVTTEQ